MAGVNHVPVKADLCVSMGIRTPAFSCFFTIFAPSSQQKERGRAEVVNYLVLRQSP
jgi:hypothetical protein